MAAPYSIVDRFITKTTSGETLPGASIYVTDVSGTPVNLYVNRLGTATITYPSGLLPNPLTADSTGRVTFYINPGRYNIAATSLADGTVNYYDVLVGPEDALRLTEISGDVAVIPTWAAISALTLTAAGQIFALAQHTYGGLGGGMFESFAGSVTEISGIQKNALGGYYLKRVDYGTPTIEMFGGVSDGTTNDAIPFIRSKNEKEVVVTGTSIVSGGTVPLINDVANVSYVGDGKIFDIYRKRVIPKQSMSSDMSCINFIPSKQFKQFCLAASIGKANVCLVGDSIGTWSANTFMRGDMIAGILENVLNKQAPYGVNFYDRAIGGKTFGDLFSVQYNSSIAWYNTPGAVWSDYLDATNGDAHIVHFGMNDANAISHTSVKAYTDFYAAKAKPPSIMFCTNLIPCPKSVSMVPTAKIAMEAREQAAGFVRSYANFYGFALLDLNRAMCMAQDGYDPLSTVNKLSATGVPRVTAGLNYTWTRPQQCSDWFVAPSWNDSNTGWSFTINTGTHAGDFIQVSRNSTNILLSMASQNIGYVSVAIPYTFANAVGQHIAFEKKGNRLMMYKLVNAAYQDPLFVSNIISNGGIFDIVVACPISNPILGVDIHASEYILNTPSIKNEQLWGDESLAFNEYMGSGFNHPSHLAAGHVYRRLVERTRFYDRLELQGTIAVPSGTTNIAVMPPGMNAVSSAFNVQLTAKTGAPGVPYRVEFQATNGFSIYFSGATTAATNIHWKLSL